MSRVDIRIQEIEPIQIYGLQRTVTSRGFDSVYADLHQTLKEKKIIPVGPPLAIFLDEEYHPEALRVNLALPVAGTPAGSQLLPGGQAAVAIHVGPYNALPEVYQQMSAYLRQHQLQQRGHHYNIYLNGRAKSPDGSEWLTKVVFPLET